MLRNLFTITWRSLIRNRFHTAINITGLTIGLSTCLVIYLIVSFELSFNKDFKDYESIYRVHSSFAGVFSGLNRGVPVPTGPAIRDQFTGIESVASFSLLQSVVTLPEGDEVRDMGNQPDVIVAEPSFFNVFSNYEWIVGDIQSMEEPFKTVLTESKAKTYFGVADASILGKEIIYRDSLHTTVSGIVRDLPFHTDITFNDFISYSTVEKSWLSKTLGLDQWGSVNSSSQLFIKLAPGTPLKKIQEQVPLLSARYKEENQNVDNNFNLQPLSDLHYNAETGIFDTSRAPAHLPTLSALILVAIMLLIIGAINFINLETAQSLRRAKEVGVRKVMGSTQGRLVFQFLTQSFLITVVSVMLAIPLTKFGLVYFEEFVPEGVTLNIAELAPFLMAMIIIVSLLAGLYPAFAIASFSPTRALKNQIAGSRNSGALFLRKSLIVFQFTFAQLLIIATLIVGWQVNYLLTKNLGFNKDAIIYFDTPWRVDHSKTFVLKNELEKIPGITAISLSEAPPAYNGWSSSTVTYHGKEEVKLNAFRKFGDVNYTTLYGIEILAGRNVLPSDTVREFLINETLMKQLGFSSPIDALGEELELGNKKIYPIVGVVKDFHIQSLRKQIEPVFIANSMNSFTCLNVQLAAAEGDQVKTTLSKIEDTWKTIYPDNKINVHFLDETVNNFYQSEKRTTKLVRTATGLAIFISCLGLFGLASYTATQRTKEIGIRKVLGASAQSIAMLLSRDFLVLVIIALVLASPLAWIAGNRWLETYAYKVEIKIWLFFITAVAGILIALLTVSYQTLKAANSNPVHSLRNE